VIVFTKSGFTGRIVASHRPPVPVLALTDSPMVARQLALVWGVVPALVPAQENYATMAELALKLAVERGLAAPGDRVVVTAGHPVNTPGTTNLMKVEVVP
jgi:pyruvate kinase